MLPGLTSDGELPPGVHKGTLEEVEYRFAVFQRSDRRLRVFQKLQSLIVEAKRSGIVKRVFIAGSFVTAKAEPNDFDCLLVLDPSIAGEDLSPLQYNLVSHKSARRLYGGDIFCAFQNSAALARYVEFFQTTRQGRRVGIVEIEL